MFHKRLLAEFRMHRKLIVGMVLAQWITLLLQMLLVYRTALFLEYLRSDSMTERIVMWLIITLVVVIFGKSVMGYVHQRLSFEASSVVKKSLREKIYEKLMQIGVGYTDVIPTAEAVQISTEGVEQLEIYFAKYVPQFFYSLLAPLTLFAVISRMKLRVALALLVCVPLIPLSIVAVQKFAKKLLQKYWGSYTELGDSFLENIKGLTTLKIFQADGYYEKKMNEEAEKFRKVTMRVLIMQLNSISVMDLVAYGGTAIGIVLSILALRSGEIGFVECFFIMMISAEFFLPLRLLGSYFHIAMNGNAAADKIFALLDFHVCANVNPVAEEKRVECEASLAVTIDQMSFGYGEESVVQDISIKMKRNSFTALVGESGCGKSTLAALLMGWQMPREGNICILGKKTENWEMKERCKDITYVGYNSYLIHGTVRENLMMGNVTATEEEMENALAKVDMLEHVRKAGGLDAVIMDGASNISGGQKQRISLARALLHQSSIYIFDEATSNIDSESEDRILRVIEQLAKEKTVLLISHRLANVIHADQILVLRDGKIVEQGTHEELMALQKGHYCCLTKKQRSLEAYRTV